MRAAFLLIDGYNLMHAAGLAREKYGPGGLERSRNKLLEFLSTRLTDAQRARTTVIFDAADAPPGLPREARLDGMKILFAGPDEDADTVIEWLIKDHSAPRQLCVVSGDRRLHRAVRRRRGYFVRSEAFLARLESQHEKQEQLDPSHEQLLKSGKESTVAEIEEWLEIFGELPPVSKPTPEEQFWKKRIAELFEEDDDQPGRGKSRR